MKITAALQEKLEDIFKALGFKVRYEKGTFRSGYCILESQKVVVINKFFTLESRVATLMEILREQEPDPEKLDAAQVKLLEQVKKAGESA